jgi:hypothetical protein
MSGGDALDIDVFLLFLFCRVLERVCNHAIRGDCRECTLSQRNFH